MKRHGIKPVRPCEKMHRQYVPKLKMKSMSYIITTATPIPRRPNQIHHQYRHITIPTILHPLRSSNHNSDGTTRRILDIHRHNLLRIMCIATIIRIHPPCITMDILLLQHNHRIKFLIIHIIRISMDRLITIARTLQQLPHRHVRKRNARAAIV